MLETMTIESSRAEADAPEESESELKIEPRWPVALAVLSFIALTIAVRFAEPHRETLGPRWLVPGIEIATLLALLAADPAHAVRRRWWLRPIAVALVVSLVVVALLSTAVLISELIRGGKVTDSADSLL